MDLLQQAADSYSNMMNYEYYITVGKSGKLTSYILQFTENEFKHVAGLHKLKDLDEIRRSSSKKLLDDISQSTLTLSDIQNSEEYPKIEKRLRNMPYLEHYLDNATSFYNWDIEKAASFSQIKANIMLPYKSQMNNNETAYVFFKHENNNILQLTDYFTETAKVENTVTLISDKRDYTKGQTRPPKLLYKAKIDKITGDKTVLIDELSKQIDNTLTKTSQSPMHDIVDNLNTISSDAVLGNPKALIDLYNLSKTERPTTNIIYQICNENNLQFGSFDAFVNRKPELQTAYDKHTGVINDLTFDPTYKRLESFIDPFKNKSQEPLVWSIEKCIWERIPGGPPSNNDSEDEITETIDNKPDAPTEEPLNDSSNNSFALNTSSDNDITNDTPSNNAKPVILSRFNRAFSELPTFDTNIQDHEKSLI